MSNDLSKNAFLSQIIKSSRMYQDMMEYRQEFYTDHDSTKFENVEAYDLKVYGGGRCFSCAVYFDCWIYGQRGKTGLPAEIRNKYADLVCKVGDNWYMSDIEIFDRVK